MSHRRIAATLCCIILATCGKLGAGGLASVTITKAMAAIPGNGELRVIASPLFLTNSEQNFTFWFEEDGDGDEVRENNLETRFFICSLDVFDLGAYRACEIAPEDDDDNNPHDVYGAVKSYAVQSKLSEGRHTFYVRATTKSFMFAPSIDCGLRQGGDDYEHCGPHSSFSFQIDVTKPTITSLSLWTPLTQFVHGKTSDATLYTLVKAATSFDRGETHTQRQSKPIYVNTTQVMAEFQASEGNIQKFECRIVGWNLPEQLSLSVDELYPWTICNTPTTFTTDMFGTGYTRDGQFGFVYYEHIASNGTLSPVVGASAGAFTSNQGLEVRAVDQAGNIGPAAMMKWVIDLDIPLTRIDRRALFDGGTRTSTDNFASFEFTSSNGGLFFECRVECVGDATTDCEVSGTFEPCVSPFQVMLDVTLLVEKRRAYLFSVRATDRASNHAQCLTQPPDALSSDEFFECTSYRWSIDTTIPTMQLSADVGDGEADVTTIECASRRGGLCLVSENHIDFRLTPSLQQDQSLSYTCQFDLPIWFDCAVGGYMRAGSPTHVFPYRSDEFLQAGWERLVHLVDGKHFFKARGTNAHGTVSESIVFEWNSDAVAPIAVFTRTPATLTTQFWAFFAFGSFPIENGVRFECSWDDNEYFECNSGQAIVGQTQSEVSNTSDVSTDTQGWLAWQNKDHPFDSSADGGVDEEIALCPSHSATPDEPPTAIECRVADTLQAWDEVGQVLHTPCTLNHGVVCRNSDQVDARLCLDYEIRIQCGNVSTTSTTMLVNVVDEFELFLDGDTTPIASGDDWTFVNELKVPSNFSVLAVRAVSYAGAHNDTGWSSAGVLVSIPALGLVSDAQWKCLGIVGDTQQPPADWFAIDFDDHVWDDAVGHGFNGDDPWGLQYLRSYSSWPSPIRHSAHAQWIWARSREGVVPTRSYCRLQQSINPALAPSSSDYTVAQGKNSLFVRGVDLAGNVQSPSSVFTWEVDVTPPVVELFWTPMGDIHSKQREGDIDRVGSSDAEFRFRVVDEVDSTASQPYRGHNVKSRFRMRLDGEVLNSFYCSPGSYLCGDTCRVISACDHNLTDEIKIDGLNTSCSGLLEGCDKEALLTSPIIFANLAPTYHTLEMWAIDTMGNVGPTTTYEWVIDTDMPVVALAPSNFSSSTRLWLFEYTVSAKPGVFECVRDLQCGVKKTRQQSNNEVAVVVWSSCASNLATKCSGVVIHTVDVTVVTVVPPSTTPALAFIQRIVTLAGDVGTNPRLRSVKTVTKHPLTLVYEGGVVLSGRRVQWEHSNAAITSLVDTTLEGCLSSCTTDLECKVVYFAVRGGVCTTIDAYVSESVLDATASFTYVRIEATPPLPALRVEYSVDVAQSRNGADVMKATADNLTRVAVVGVSSTTSSTSTLAQPIKALNARSLVHAVIVGYGFGKSNFLSAADVRVALLVELAARQATREAPIITATGVRGDRTTMQITVGCDGGEGGEQCGGVATAFEQAFTSGSVWRLMLKANSSAYDRWTLVSDFQVTSRNASLQWVSSVVVKAMFIDALKQQDDVGKWDGLVSADVSHANVTALFPHTGYAVNVIIQLGAPSTALSAAQITALKTTLYSLKFRHFLKTQLVTVTKDDSLEVVRGQLPTVSRVTHLANFSYRPSVIKPNVSEAFKPRFSSTHSKHTVEYVGCDAARRQRDVGATTTPTPTPTSTPLPCLTDGDYTFMVRAVDISGNEGPTTSSAFNVDSIPPWIQWKRRPPTLANIQRSDGDTEEKRQVFDFQSNEADEIGSDTSTFECALVQGWVGVRESALGYCRPPVSYDIVEAGKYTFFVRATDAAGNVGRVDAYAFEVDVTKPTATIVSGVPNTFTTNVEHVRLEINTSEVGILWCSLEIGNCIINNTCYDDDEGIAGHGNAPYHVCTSPVDIATLSSFVQTFPQGSSVGDPPVLYRFRVVVEDVAGNLQDTPDTAVWTHDTASPIVRIMQATRPFSLSAQARPRLGFTVEGSLDARLTVKENPTNNHPLTIAQYYAPSTTECLVLTGTEIDTYDDALTEIQRAWGGWEDCVSPYQTNVVVGRAAFFVRCTDVAGNDGNIDVARWVLDGDPPYFDAQIKDGDTTMVMVERKYQAGAPIPRRYDAGNAMAVVVLSHVDDNAGDGDGDDDGDDDGDGGCGGGDGGDGGGGKNGPTLTLTRQSTSDVLFTIELVDPSDSITTLRLLFPLPSTPNQAVVSPPRVLYSMSSPPLVGGALKLDPLTLRLLFSDVVKVELVSTSNTLFKGCISMRYSNYFEFYPNNSLAMIAEEQEDVELGPRLQCCLDGNCDSNCKVCDVSMLTTSSSSTSTSTSSSSSSSSPTSSPSPWCATDCSSSSSMLSSRCSCATLAQFGGWPHGYSNTSTGLNVTSKVPNDVWETPWDCKPGAYVVRDLRAGRHVFAVRSIDQALRPSTTPLLFAWDIDAIVPVIGLVSVPPITTISNAISVVFRTSELLQTYTCKLDGTTTTTTTTASSSTTTSSSSSSSTTSTTSSTTTSCAQMSSTSKTFTSNLIGLSDGAHTFEVTGIDLAGNVQQGLPPLINWTVDTTLPRLAIASTMAVHDSIRATFEIEDGATVMCTLTRTATTSTTTTTATTTVTTAIPTGTATATATTTITEADNNGDGGDGDAGGDSSNGETIQKCMGTLDGSQSVISISGYTPRVGVVGDAVDGGDGDGDGGDGVDDVSGVYTRRMCIDGPCSYSNRSMYDHELFLTELYYETQSWFLVGPNATVLATVVSDAMSPHLIDVTTSLWTTADGEELRGLRIHTDPCMGHCQAYAWYQGLPSGVYDLCVTATDVSGNVGEAVCTRSINVTSLSDERVALEQSSWEALEPCLLKEYEIPMMIASIVGFILLVLVLSIFIYHERKLRAQHLAVKHKQEAVLSSTVGFGSAQFSDSQMMF